MYKEIVQADQFEVEKVHQRETSHSIKNRSYISGYALLPHRRAMKFIVRKVV